MRHWIITAGVRAARVVIDVLDALFPGPPDDLMTIADSTYEPPADTVVADDELADYHAAVCELVEANAASRRAVEPLDWADWETECSQGGAR